MTTLAEFTSPGLIVPQLFGCDAVSAIEELCAVLWREGRIPDQEQFRKVVINRELRCATVIAPGWALPHARSADLPQLSFALGRASSPFGWLGTRQVQMVFLLAVPEAEATAYLNLIAGLARFSGDSPRQERLREASDAREMLDVLAEVILPTAGGLSARRQVVRAA